MEVSVISDRISSISKIQSHSAAKLLLDRHSFQITAAIRPMDAASKPLVKSHNMKKSRRGLLTKRRRRTKRTSKTEAGGTDDYMSGGGDGPYGGTGGGWGGNGGGGGGGGGSYGFNWDESSSASPADRAFDIVYEVLSWIIFTNCLHFAFKKIVRSMRNGTAEAVMGGKAPLRRLTPVC